MTADEKLAYIEVVLASNLIDSSKLLAIEECLAGGDTWVRPVRTTGDICSPNDSANDKLEGAA